MWTNLIQISNCANHTNPYPNATRTDRKLFWYQLIICHCKIVNELETSYYLEKVLFSSKILLFTQKGWIFRCLPNFKIFLLKIMLFQKSKNIGTSVIESITLGELVLWVRKTRFKWSRFSFWVQTKCEVVIFCCLFPVHFNSMCQNTWNLAGELCKVSRCLS